jgi:TonB-dependent starch-binding outer membrane protein SusC
VQNVVVGFRLPAALTRRFGATATAPRVYLNVQNLYTFTNYTGWDPEVFGSDPSGRGNALARGVDAGRIYPQARTVTLGLDLRL